MICFDMTSQGSQDTGLDYLLGLDGNIEVQNDDGYWVKMEVTRVDVTSSMQVKSTPMTIGTDTSGMKVCCTSLTTLTS